ncbi:MAG TPA: hypothetical protein ENK00_05675 [Chromatiales bacterium]|nr:hypothetical protein [Chromatiales bacterium]
MKDVQQLQRAFEGATSLALLLTWLLLALLTPWLLHDKVETLWGLLGLLLLGMALAFLLMLFLTGLVRASVRLLFQLLSPRWRAAHGQKPDASRD